MESTSPIDLCQLTKEAELVYETTATTLWFASHDAALQLSELVIVRQLCTATCAWQLRLILHELLRNAIEHGNLEVSSHQKHTSLDSLQHYYHQIEEALNSPLTQRHITLSLWYKNKTFIGQVQDDGLGFCNQHSQGLGLDLLKKNNLVTHLFKQR